MTEGLVAELIDTCVKVTVVITGRHQHQGNQALHRREGHHHHGKGHHHYLKQKVRNFKCVIRGRGDIEEATTY